MERTRWNGLRARSSRQGAHGKGLARAARGACGALCDCGAAPVGMGRCFGIGAVQASRDPSDRREHAVSRRGMRGRGRVPRETGQVLHLAGRGRHRDRPHGTVRHGRWCSVTLALSRPVPRETGRRGSGCAAPRSAPSPSSISRSSRSSTSRDRAPPRSSVWALRASVRAPSRRPRATYRVPRTLPPTACHVLPATHHVPRTACQPPRSTYRVYARRARYRAPRATVPRETGRVHHVIDGVGHRRRPHGARTVRLAQAPVRLPECEVAPFHVKRGRTQARARRRVMRTRYRRRSSQHTMSRPRDGVLNPRLHDLIEDIRAT
jgi:hypothetical protein